jgi:hypothetical protein
MKSLPFVGENDFAASCTHEEAQALEDGLRLLAKLIAKAIQRSGESQNAEGTKLLRVK